MAEKKNLIPLKMAPGGEAREAPLLRQLEQTATSAIEAIEAGQPIGVPGQTLTENLLDDYAKDADAAAADIPHMAVAAETARSAIEAVQKGRRLTEDEASIAVNLLIDRRHETRQLAEQFEAVAAAQAAEDAEDAPQ